MRVWRGAREQQSTACNANRLVVPHLCRPSRQVSGLDSVAAGGEERLKLKLCRRLRQKVTRSRPAWATK